MNDFVKHDGFDFEKLLPGGLNNGTFEYYFYWGSYTTPPCKENVMWLILKNRGYISEQQIQEFSTYISQNQVPNKRPLQPLNKRKVVTKIPARLKGQYCNDRTDREYMCNQQWDKLGLNVPHKTIESLSEASVYEVCKFYEEEQAQVSPSPSGSPTPRHSPGPSGSPSPSPSGTPTPTPTAEATPTPSPIIVKKPKNVMYNGHRVGDKAFGWQQRANGIVTDSFPCNEAGGVGCQADPAVQPENAWEPYEDVFKDSVVNPQIEGTEGNIYGSKWHVDE